jgi:hypothetical protein
MFVLVGLATHLAQDQGHAFRMTQIQSRDYPSLQLIRDPSHIKGPLAHDGPDPASVLITNETLQKVPSIHSPMLVLKGSIQYQSLDATQVVVHDDLWDWGFG